MIPAGFRGAALPRSPDIYDQIAEKIGVPVPQLRGFTLTEVAIESGFLADGTGRPQELLEKHKFKLFTSGRFDAVAPEVSGPAGGYLVQPAEYERLYTAYDLDQSAALKATSWGMHQGMGFNFGLMGYDFVEAYVEDCCESEDLQLWAFSRFLVRTGIAADLKNAKYAAAIAKYNGSGNVDSYLRRFLGNVAKVQATHNYVDAPARHDLAGVQAILNLLGYGPLSVDGIIGDKSKAAIRRFQTDNGLTVDGVAGPATQAALYSDVPLPMAKPN